MNWKWQCGKSRGELCVLTACTDAWIVLSHLGIIHASLNKWRYSIWWLLLYCTEGLDYLVQLEFRCNPKEHTSCRLFWHCVQPVFGWWIVECAYQSPKTNWPEAWQKALRVGWPVRGFQTYVCTSIQKYSQGVLRFSHGIDMHPQVFWCIYDAVTWILHMMLVLQHLLLPGLPVLLQLRLDTKHYMHAFFLSCNCSTTTFHQTSLPATGKELKDKVKQENKTLFWTKLLFQDAGQGSPLAKTPGQCSREYDGILGWWTSVKLNGGRKIGIGAVILKDSPRKWDNIWGLTTALQNWKRLAVLASTLRVTHRTVPPKKTGENGPKKSKRETWKNLIPSIINGKTQQISSSIVLGWWNTIGNVCKMAGSLGGVGALFKKKREKKIVWRNCTFQRWI